MIFDQYDGELAGDEREAAKLHLAGCADCRRALADWKALSAAAFAADKEFDPPDLAARVTFAIKEEERSTGSFLRALRAYATLPRLAAGMAVIALILSLLRPVIVRRKTANIEGTAFVAELMTPDTAETDSYSQVSDYILGS